MGWETVVYLEISTWQGLSPDADHVYGKLYCRDRDSVELEKTLTAGEAAELNKKDGVGNWAGGRGLFRSGSTSTRFKSRDELRELAIHTYKDHFPEAVVLIEGRGSCASVQPMLDGPSEIKERVNALVARAEEIGYYKRYGDNAEMEGLDEEWYEIYAQLTGIVYER